MSLSLFALPLLACLGLSLMTCSIGPMLIWRRMAFLSDSLSHGAIFGFTLAQILGLPPLVGVLFIGTLFIGYWHFQRHHPSDLGLAIFSYGSLFAGLSLSYAFPGRTIDPIGYFVGDLFLIHPQDFIIIVVAILLVSIFLGRYWHQLLLITFDEDLARVQRLHVNALNLGFLAIVVVVIAIGIKIFGGFLFPGFLLLPAASTRFFTLCPEKMVWITFVFSILGSIGGLGLSLYFDIPGSLGICLCLILIYGVCSIIQQFFKRFINYL